MPRAHTFRSVSGPSLADGVFLADRFNDTGGWSEDCAESWIGTLAGGHLWLTMGQLGWITQLWRSPSGLTFASEGGTYRQGVHVNGSIDAHAPAWHFFPMPFVVAGVWGLDDRFVLAWGTSSTGVGTYRQHVVRWDGLSWQPLPEPPDMIMDVHGLAPDLVYAVGEHGLIARWDGMGWKRVPGPVQGQLSSVHVVSPDEMYACGTRGQLLQGSVYGWSLLCTDEVALSSVVKWRGEVWVASVSAGLRKLAGNALLDVEPALKAHRLDARGKLVGACADRLFETDDGQAFTSVPADLFKTAIRGTRPLWIK